MSFEDKEEFLKNNQTTINAIIYELQKSLIMRLEVLEAVVMEDLKDAKITLQMKEDGQIKIRSKIRFDDFSMDITGKRSKKDSTNMKEYKGFISEMVDQHLRNKEPELIEESEEENQDDEHISI